MIKIKGTDRYLSLIHMGNSCYLTISDKNIHGYYYIIGIGSGMELPICISWDFDFNLTHNGSLKVIGIDTYDD
jgi:hypothetical protein